MRRILRNDHLLLAALALIVGAASAYGTFLFRLGIDFLQEASFGFALNETMPTTDVLAWWHIILVPTLGGLFVGLFLHFANGGERAHTIAQVIEASALRGGQITPRAGLTSFVAHGVS
ncbi:MAG: chloride channel protein, partial [Alphaproteobacteria bacterium]